MYLNPANDEIRKRQAKEVAIVKKVVRDALAAGYTLSVDDGGDELAVNRSTSYKALLDGLLNTDDDTLVLERFKDGQRIEYGWVKFVYGNDGWDVISDYTTNLEDVLAGANKLASELEERA